MSITSTGNYNAASRTLTLAADGPPAQFTVNGAVSYVINETNVGTTACPTDAVAIANLVPDSTNQALNAAAGYLAATCTYSIGEPQSGSIEAVATFTIVVTAAATPPPEIGSIIVENDSLETYDASNLENTGFLTAAGDSAFVRDSSGATFVDTSGTISKYATPFGAFGPENRVASVTIGNSGLGGLAVDAAGHLYVLDEINNQVIEFSSDLSTEIATLGGGTTLLGLDTYGGTYPDSIDALAVDARGIVYVLTTSGIREYPALAPGANDTAPILTIPESYGYPDDSQQIALDAAGDVFFNKGSFGSINEYAAGTANAIASYDVSGNFETFTILGNRLYAAETGFDSFTQQPNLVYFTIGSSAPAVPVFTHGGAYALQGVAPASASAAAQRKRQARS